MSAQRIGVFTIDFPDPAAINYDNNKFNTLNDSISFQYRIPGNVQTLSTKGVDSGSDPYGILYVPDLQSDACKSQEQQHVPANATRLANLPRGKNYALIAVAPWFSPQCMLEYFNAARRITTKGIFVYQPGQGNAKPPVLNDASWNLQDGGRWQSENSFPTYALSSTTGDNIMDQLGLYSGNLTDVPHGEQLATIFDRSDYVRLWATVATDSSTQLPSLWVFLVIVLAILLVAVTGTSIAMHIIQRRRRNDLRRRVLEGEVDLEALGVKRLKVDQQTLDKLPIYTYTGDTEKTTPKPPQPALAAGTPSVDGDTGVKASQLIRRSSMPSVGAPSTAWSQATCPICLDDFEPHETQVRELPCRHIFHPDCIDQFLLRNSSLCPMCKQSVLPAGACPVNITNMMVRRERHIIRMRARGANLTSGQTDAVRPSVVEQHVHTQSPPAGPLGSLRGRLGGAMAGRRIFSAPERTQPRPADIEMANGSTTTTTLPSNITPTEQGAHEPATPTSMQDCTPSQNRREWARQRALRLLGNRHTPASDAEEELTGPRWRRILHKVFPGFR
ncbi:hypothetical protein CC86DRAFT_387137 [Ophiobolus disseminans]|uniref:RING-type domain-containing protein n=1 Tax=Ophiobolus disseminans TaxID=1469910 RepID=A0A6A6ZK86_9PLEO|nr:hypothetical protein CC86DRAFT_387137 [Ophiobolus disseminans]